MTDKAKLFMDGDSQAVRLPDHYRFDGNEVYIRQDPETGDVILSTRPNGWDEFFDMLDKDPMPEDFLADRGQGELPDITPSDESDSHAGLRTIMESTDSMEAEWDEFMENLKAQDKKQAIEPKQ
ncbi:hypothetical protein [Alcanivorax sp.]|jgi:antitoxin VapB|uniref:antitoxin n=1 Tax=Alcanivorax sp. TaxID=1872427 RepID=UPI0025847B83|nr:hypothetical protein [Alcanivorax sp.]